MIEEGLEVDPVNSVHNDAAQKRDPPTKSLISSFLLELAVFKLGLVLGALLVGAAHTLIFPTTFNSFFGVKILL